MVNDTIPMIDKDVYDSYGMYRSQVMIEKMRL